MRLKKLLITLPIIACCNLSLAQDSNISYNMIGFGLTKLKLDDVKFDGGSLYGSFEINDKFFVLASISDSMSDNEFTSNYNYYSGSYSYTAEKADLILHSVGLGIHQSRSTTTDFYGHLTYNQAKVEIGNKSEKATGIELTAGLRHMLNTKVETNGYIGISNGEGETDVFAGVGIRGYFNKNFSIGASLEKSSDYHQLLADLRYSF